MTYAEIGAAEKPALSIGGFSNVEAVLYTPTIHSNVIN
jgi:hypothetical protein